MATEKTKALWRELISKLKELKVPKEEAEIWLIRLSTDERLEKMMQYIRKNPKATLPELQKEATRIVRTELGLPMPE